MTPEQQLRLAALHVAQDHTNRVPNGTTKAADVVARAESYAKFLRG